MVEKKYEENKMIFILKSCISLIYQELSMNGFYANESLTKNRNNFIKKEIRS